MSESKDDTRVGLGIVIGVSKPEQVTFESKRPVSIGEYVILSYGKGTRRVLGLVEKSMISSDALGASIRNYDEAFECRQIALENSRDKSFKGIIRVLGYLDELDKCKAVIPALPPEPGTEVFEAAPHDLAGIFSSSAPEWVHVGSLLRNNQVDAKVNIDKVVSRHLAILAMTGMGKSNLVSLLAKEVAKLRGTMVIFDYHDDYSSLEMGNMMDARINPRLLSSDKLADVIEIQDNASNQRHVLRVALTEDVKQRKGNDFWEVLQANATDVGADDKSYREASERVLDKIEDARRKFGNILDAGLDDPVRLVKNGKLNVINLVELTEKQANIVVSYYLQELLDDRKMATRFRKDSKRDPKFPAPVLAVIEEAHVFVPKDEDTETKYYASKVAREGRKFGLGLVIVSQRPRGIDSNILSQMGSLAVMRMIQQDDQAHVSAASESLSRDLIDQLTSLNPGEAIFAGQWVNLPTFVRISEVKNRRVGGDQRAVEAWRQLARITEVSKDSAESYIPPGYIQD